MSVEPQPNRIHSDQAPQGANCGYNISHLYCNSHADNHAFVLDTIARI